MADLILSGTVTDCGIGTHPNAHKAITMANPQNANDGNPATAATADSDADNCGGGSQPLIKRGLKVDLGAAFSASGMTLRLNEWTGTSWQVDVSDNGTDWTSVTLTSSTHVNDVTTLEFAVTEARWWRVVWCKNTGTFWGCGGLAIYTWSMDEYVPPPDDPGVFVDWDGDGFGALATDDDLSGDIASWVITRGASPEITGGASPGSATLTIINRADDRYNPLNAGGPLYGSLTDGVPIWIGVNSDGALTGTDPRGLFAGRIKDVTPLPGPGTAYAPFVEITCEDALGWYGRTPVKIDFDEGRSHHDLRDELLAAAGETRFLLAYEPETMPLSAADGDLLGALEAINRVNGSRHFCHPSDNRDDWYDYETRNRQHGLDAAADASLSVLDDHVTGTSGWRQSADTVINRQRATVTPVVFTAGTARVYQAPELPIEVRTTRPYDLLVTFDDVVDAPVLNLAYTGSAVTSSVTGYGTSARIQMSVASGTAVVTQLSVEGRLARRSAAETYQADDAASQAGVRGVRSGSDISGDYLGTLASARGIAEHVVWRYGSPQLRPTLTVENWIPEQFEIDLFDTIAVTSPQLSMTARLFEVVGLTHEGRLAASAAVNHHVTTYVLQELPIQSDPGWFMLDSSLIASADMLAY